MISEELLILKFRIAGSGKVYRKGCNFPHSCSHRSVTVTFTTRTRDECHIRQCVIKSIQGCHPGYKRMPLNNLIIHYSFLSVSSRSCINSTPRINSPCQLVHWWRHYALLYTELSSIMTVKNLPVKQVRNNRKITPWLNLHDPTYVLRTDHSRRVRTCP